MPYSLAAVLSVCMRTSNRFNDPTKTMKRESKQAKQNAHTLAESEIDDMRGEKYFRVRRKKE